MFPCFSCVLRSRYAHRVQLRMWRSTIFSPLSRNHFLLFLFCLLALPTPDHSTMVTRARKSSPNSKPSSPWSFIRAPAPTKENEHPITPFGYVFMAVVATLWFVFTSSAVKFQCLVGAGLFSCTGRAPRSNAYQLCNMETHVYKYLT